MEIKHLSSEAGRAWVLVRAGQTVSGNGSMGDQAVARELYDSLDRTVFYYRLGTHAWVVDEAGLIARIEQVLEPGLTLTARQAEMGMTQGSLGGLQAKTGARLAEAGIAMGLGDRADGRAKMAAVRSEMETLAAQQKDLARQQQELGKEQREEARRADAAIDALMEDAIVEGVARDVSADSQAS